jgi:hypothetical protein
MTSCAASRRYSQFLLTQHEQGIIGVSDGRHCLLTAVTRIGVARESIVTFRLAVSAPSNHEDRRDDKEPPLEV